MTAKRPSKLCLQLMKVAASAAFAEDPSNIHCIYFHVYYRETGMYTAG